MKTATIGVIGGGQIGKMIAQEAKRMSMDMIVLDPSPNCPAAGICGRQITADFKDIAAIRKLAQESDVVTYEIELGNSGILKQLESEGFKIFPSADNLRVIQDKYVQKSFLKANRVPVPEFAEVSSREDLQEKSAAFGYPSLLKQRRDTYDGRGTVTLRKPGDLDRQLDAHALNGNLADKNYMLERFVPFVKEVSVMIARSRAGKMVSFPVVENIHENHILATTIAPARISDAVAKRARQIARKAVEAFNGVGIFGVEMFVDRKGEVLINEIAPRPHNSGHYTIEACAHSQFEMHLRAVLGLPLVEPTLLSPAVLVNILGRSAIDGAYRLKDLDKLLAIPGAKLHLYGKQGVRPGRKLGHVTILDATVAGAMKKADKARKLIEVVPA